MSGPYHQNRLAKRKKNRYSKTICCFCACVLEFAGKESRWRRRFYLAVCFSFGSYLFTDVCLYPLDNTPPDRFDWSEIYIRQCFTNRKLAIGVAVFNPLSYILVLTALVFTPVSYVAPAREISILFGTLMGTHILSEGHSRRRIISACIMILGVIGLSLG